MVDSTAGREQSLKGPARLEKRQFRQQKLHEMVAEELERLILAGEYGSGQVLPPERELTTQFGVSRTVVRDAIRTLAAKGLVVVQQGVGAIVTTNARHALMDSLRLTLRRGEFAQGEMTEVREILEVNITGLAAQRATPEDLASLEEILGRWAGAAEVLPWDETVTIHHEFHLALIQAAHNRVLTALIHPIAELLLISAVPQDPGPGAVRDYQKHRLIYERIRAGDAAAARAAMRRHFLPPDEA